MARWRSARVTALAIAGIDGLPIGLIVTVGWIVIVVWKISA